MPSHSILVAGDLVLDHHLYEGPDSHAGRMAPRVELREEIGGANLIADLLRELVSTQTRPRAAPWTIHLAKTESIHHAYAYWRPSPHEAPYDKQVWRVGEAIGFAETAATPGRTNPRPSQSVAQPSIVVLADSVLGFRQSPDAWPGMELNRARWIVLKTTAPVGEGALWQRLVSARRDRLVVVIAARDLRRTTARLSVALSWEETIQNLLGELGPAGTLNALMRCRHLIVTFGVEGAMWIDFGSATRSDGLRRTARVHVVYDPAGIEGDRSSRTEGTVLGLRSCMAAAVAWQLTQEGPDAAGALEAGLVAMRDLMDRGHGPAAEAPQGFPTSRLARAMTTSQFSFSRAVFPIGAALSGSQWSIVRHAQHGAGPLYALARLVLLRGPIALANVPHVRIGRYVTADRQEIESLRSLVQLVRRYQHHDPGRKPLSIGVFGPPGSGKSFAVSELASHVLGSEGWMEFNLSQFDSTADLIGAFHQIRDKVLQGKLPVAFFDEFDARSNRWLASLLAPMQDGRFQEGPLTHTLGKCIFVFAGGTSSTFDTFGPVEPPKGRETAAWWEFKLAKGPDFKSRLDGYLNVVGPNSRTATNVDDISFPLRRALMIRSELKCGVDDKLDLDEGLVHALLRVERYCHGSRSLGKILQPLTTAYPMPLRRSLLAPDAQLGMHVDAEAFMRLCAAAPPSPYQPQSPLTGRQVESVAPAIHETWRALGVKNGWLKREGDEPFARLTDSLKDSNRAAASRMLENLALVNLRVVRGAATVAEEQAIRDHLEYMLEMLAEAEHDGWMEWHLARGWRYAVIRDDARHRHPCLLPFRLLKRADVDKDRESVRHYPDFVRAAGMKIVPAGQTVRSRRTKVRVG